jgi:hypothetical protein
MHDYSWTMQTSATEIFDKVVGPAILSTVTAHSQPSYEHAVRQAWKRAQAACTEHDKKEGDITMSKKQVSAYRCLKCSALWLFYPKEITTFETDTLNLRSPNSCDECEPAWIEDLQLLPSIEDLFVLEKEGEVSPGFLTTQFLLLLHGDSLQKENALNNFSDVIAVMTARMSTSKQSDPVTTGEVLHFPV